MTGVTPRTTGALALPTSSRSRRSRRPLELALLDVDAIKTGSDYQSPPPGDELCAMWARPRLDAALVQRPGPLARRRVRVRLLGLTREVASDRVAGIQRAPKAGGATIGARLVDDTLESLIDRAEASVQLARAQPRQPFLSRFRRQTAA